jgi:pimeloyl-ACP methyl ester carboxylesterase
MFRWLLTLFLLIAPLSAVAQTPYSEREVRVANGAASVELAGTLTLPAGPGPFPGVVLITGAGPQDRDETVAGHKPFAVLADHLARQGVAVLRYDDRGVGQSSGDFGAATLLDFSSDARAALDFLRTQPEVDGRRTGLLGHSEGGLVAPMVTLGAPAGDVAFLILMASPGVTGEQIYYLQDAAEARVAGVDPAVIERMRHRKQQMFAVVMAEPDRAVAADRLRTVMHGFELAPEERAEIEAQGVDLDQVIDQQIALINTEAQRVFLTYDPLPALGRLTIPVLVLNGERDLQVPPGDNLPLIHAALNHPEACPATEIRELPGLNHLFQTAETGLPRDYAGIRETMAPIALNVVSDWILARD